MAYFDNRYGVSGSGMAIEGQLPYATWEGICNYGKIGSVEKCFRFYHVEF
jgi:hypothetical protein